MARSFHLNSGQVGMAVSAYALIVAALAVPLTIVTARVNRKRLVLLALAGYAASNLMGAFAPSFWLLCVGRAVGGGACAAHVHRLGLCGPACAPAGYRTGHFVRVLWCVVRRGGGVPAAAAIGQFLGWRAGWPPCWRWW
ncbi:MFS transporter [Komagataeibacter rhaeticus]|nr:MFS transporter [Komagataeibacter rhaeticus]